MDSSDPIYCESIELENERRRTHDELRFVLRNLRHMYDQLVNGHVRTTQEAHTSIANGILSPQIARIERLLDKP